MREPCRLLYRLTVALQGLGIARCFPLLRRHSAQDLARPLFLLSVSIAKYSLLAAGDLQTTWADNCEVCWYLRILKK